MEHFPKIRAQLASKVSLGLEVCSSWVPMVFHLPHPLVEVVVDVPEQLDVTSLGIPTISILRGEREFEALKVRQWPQ
jgi:hypothetical protein